MDINEKGLRVKFPSVKQRESFIHKMHRDPKLRQIDIEYIDDVTIGIILQREKQEERF